MYVINQPKPPMPIPCLNTNDKSCFRLDEDVLLIATAVQTACTGDSVIDDRDEITANEWRDGWPVLSSARDRKMHLSCPNRFRRTFVFVFVFVRSVMFHSGCEYRKQIT